MTRKARFWKSSAFMLLVLAGCSSADPAPPFELDPSLATTAWASGDCTETSDIPWPAFTGGMTACTESLGDLPEHLENVPRYQSVSLPRDEGDYWLVAICRGVEELRITFEDSPHSDFTEPCALGTVVVKHLGYLAQGEDPGWIMIHDSKVPGSFVVRIGAMS